MADDDPDRLSQLPDELLLHILQLAPCREAESTAVLSRRWRGLWPPPTSAVKFDIPSVDNQRLDASTRGAKEALAAAQGPVKRLSIRVSEGCEFADVVVEDVLSYMASRSVEDVRIAPLDDDSSCVRYKDDASWSWLPDDQVGEFDFSFGSVASAALRLRVLHITSCRDLTPPPPASTFPCLEVLRLRKCCVDLETIQDMVVASPQLAVLQLEYVFFTTETESPSSPMAGAQWQWPGYYNGNSGRRRHLPQSLCCPGITTLVLLNCDCEWGKHIAVELDVPMVQHFRYRGRIDRFRLRSPLLDVRRVCLHFLDSLNCQVFWKFLKNFGDAKVLKLKLECKIDYVAEPDRETFRELLGETTFNVEHLEIDARHNPTRKDAAVAIGNLLQCCPVLLDLRLKLNTAEQPMRSTVLENKAELEFYKSVDHFRRRRDQVIPMCAEDDKAELVSDVPGLSDRWFHFNCLRFHLRRLSLQFQMDKPDCVGIQLARFFVERAMALEEMYIDDGNMRLWEHMNCKVSGYAANPQPSSEHHVLVRMSEAHSVNQFSSSKITGWLHHRRVEVRRTQPWSAVSGSFTIVPLADHLRYL